MTPLKYERSIKLCKHPSETDSTFLYSQRKFLWTVLTCCTVYLSQHDAVDTEHRLFPIGGAGVKQI